MTKIPEPTTTIQSLIDDYHETQQEPPRGHLGCSLLGHACDRRLWLSFRWAIADKFPGRVLRLFRRGQQEEPTVVTDLRAIGMVIDQTGDDQARVNLGCHLSGSVDGRIRSGVLGAMKTAHVLEIKTHNKRSFNDVSKHGVAKSKPQHAAQMHLYMMGTGLKRALYVAVCKDDDRIYTERLQYDHGEAQRLVAKGRRIVLSDRLPEPVSSDPDWYQCKMCSASEFCHTSHLAEQVNCRTCAHVTPKGNSDWHCARYDADGIPEDHQRTGCECHVLHPDLVPWVRVDSGNPHEAIYIIGDAEVRNGEPCRGTFSSKEIIADAAGCAAGGVVVEEARDIFDGRIVTP